MAAGSPVDYRTERERATLEIETHRAYNEADNDASVSSTATFSYAVHGTTQFQQRSEAIGALDLAWLAHQDLARDDQVAVGNGASAAGSTVSYLDASTRAVDEIHALAARGDAEALSAFLILGPASPAYRERSLELLYIHAANGNVLALSTIAEWLASGFGFSSIDTTSSIAFEYIAWSTGQWGGDEFSPSSERRWSAEQCRIGSAAGRAFAIGKPWAVRLTTGEDVLACASRNG